MRTYSKRTEVNTAFQKYFSFYASPNNGFTYDKILHEICSSMKCNASGTQRWGTEEGAVGEGEWEHFVAPACKMFSQHFAIVFALR